MCLGAQWVWLLDVSLGLSAHMCMPYARCLMHVPLCVCVSGSIVSTNSDSAKGFWRPLNLRVILRALPLWSPYPHFCCRTKPGLLTGAREG